MQFALSWNSFTWMFYRIPVVECWLLFVHNFYGAAEFTEVMHVNDKKQAYMILCQ
jgi:hypothetical protein